jgi:intracellular sulfur oxidation DsrE/DsrF family protein
LKLSGETLDSLIAQGIKPEMVVAFRGPGIGLLSTSELDEEALDLIRALKKKGVRFEACAMAMRTFKADPTRLVWEIKLVANVFNSLIGYQHKGYALIVIN